MDSSTEHMFSMEVMIPVVTTSTKVFGMHLLVKCCESEVGNINLLGCMVLESCKDLSTQSIACHKARLHPTIYLPTHWQKKYPKVGFSHLILHSGWVEAVYH